MLRVLLIIGLVARSRAALVTNSPTFAKTLDKLYEKLERLTISPIPNENLYEKLDKLNSLTPDRDFTDDDEELLSAMQRWGNISDAQLRGLVRELQRMKDDKSDRFPDGDYDGEWNDEELDRELSDGDYANDGGEDWDTLDDDISSTIRPGLGVTPSAIIRLDGYHLNVVSSIDPIAATNDRPMILNDSQPKEKRTIEKEAFVNMATVVKAGKCLVPQPRWLSVRKLAPAADTVYMPPCVQLHRCAPDSGCCYDEAEVCAPAEGRYITKSFLLNKADGTLIPARMVFFNHTRCECISRERLENAQRMKIDTPVLDDRPEGSREKQNDWEGPERVRPPTEEPRLEKDEEQTTPPQLLRCTCPMLFKNHIKNGTCTCTCDWTDASRRRDCQSLSRGREHFGLRDRVCIERGDCHPPACDQGTYEVRAGKCPPRRLKRRYYIRSRYHAQTRG